MPSSGLLKSTQGANIFGARSRQPCLRTIVKLRFVVSAPPRSRNWLSVGRMKAVLRENDPEGRTRPAMPNPRQARRIVRDRQPDGPGRMWFKPYYGIEAERVERDRGLCASAILSPEVCYLREAVGDFARWASRFVAGLPRSSFCANHHVPPMASTKACCLIDREAPIWRRNAETLTKMAALSAGSNGVTLSRKERLPNWNGRENDWRATRVL